MRVKEVNFTMRDGKQNLRESYLFTAGFLDDGSAMDHKLIRDLLDLDCISIADKQVEPESLDASLIAQLESLRGEVEDRNASFLLQQETLIDTASLGLKTKFDAKIRMYQAKKTTGTKAARKMSSTAEELKLKQEARQWRRKANDTEDEHLIECDRLRDESEEYLDSARDALNTQETRQELFTIN